ncbi:acyl-CoA dehydrogenase [Castellaniella daejeonensis]|jgi:acyl-CoA dehydrogenase|uniref:Acyl-coenzyme A dehydrogenase n=1 Tax=Castellaniella daejeonensis TaxID=659013 RepID=A0ABN0U340_9BURK
MTFLLFLLVLLLAAAAFVLANRDLRTRHLSRPLYRTFRRILPRMSDTEREALEAGTVWWEGELFRGRPSARALHAIPAPRLTEAEQAFLDNEVETVCAMVNDWQVTRNDLDIPADAWEYIKTHRFFGMIIPKEYGGLGFSALAHSAVVAKLSTRCSALSVTVMVPNSLGPAELLLHYGTDEQKNHYLPRLARGEDIPAFALTSPWAGSDAAAIPDHGIVCKGEWQGREVLGMRVTWDKRYITLGPVCTILGLAFRLYDPDGLLGDKPDLGITCALVPSDHPGVDTGRRHFPLDAMFMNGPTRGQDVFMPLDFIIGGPAMAGQGWRMLMECLAAGRSISLPSSYTGMAKLTARAVGAYTVVRDQFRTRIHKFEGIAEALARIAGHTYLMDAARVMTAGAVDLGEKPAVVSAIVKYHVTERGRIVVNDGMDIIGGKGICLGPQNFLGRAYQQIPVGITVEGANILTRSLIIFGQGAIRCHPYVLDEMRAAQAADPEQGLRDFDRAFWGHVRHTTINALRAIGHGFTNAALARPDAAVAPEMARYYRQLTRFSAAFATLADVSMLTLGGSLKRRESISARLGDILSQLYLVSATLKRYQDEGRQDADAPLAHWAIQDAFCRAQDAFCGVLANFPSRPLAWALRALLFPWGRPFAAPSDKLSAAAADTLTRPGGARDRLTRGTYVPRDPGEPVGAIEAAFAAVLDTQDIEARMREFEKAGRLPAADPRANVRDMAEAVHAAGGLTDEELERIRARNVLRDRVIAVDDFAPDFQGPSRTESEGARS